MSYYVFSFPIGRNNNFLTIGTHMILFNRNVRRIIFILVSPSITYIDINRITISIKLPYCRNTEIIPSVIIISYTEKVIRSFIRTFNPQKFPLTVKCHEIIRFFLNSFICRFKILISEKTCMHRSTINGIYLRILPLLK